MALGGFGGLGDIVAYVGVSGDAKFISKMRAMDAQAQASAKVIGKALKASMVGASVAIGGAVVAAASFESKMTDVKTLMQGESKEAFDELSESVLNFSRSVPQSANDLSEAMYQIVSATVPAEERMYALETSARAAVGGVSAVNETFNLGSSIVKGYGMSFSDLGGVYDVVFQMVESGQTTVAELNASFGGAVPIANTLGVTFEQLAGMTATLAGATGNTSEAMTQIEGIMTALAKEPTENLLKAFDALGVASGRELIEKFGGLQGAMDALTQYTRDYGVEASTLLGRKEAMVGFLAATGTLSEQLATKTEQMYNATGKANAAFDEQMKTFNNVVGILKNQVIATFIEYGNTLIPILSDVARFFAEQPNLLSGIITPLLQFVSVAGGLSLALKGVNGILGLFGTTISATAAGPIIGIIAGFIALKEILVDGPARRAMEEWEAGLVAIGESLDEVSLMFQLKQVEYQITEMKKGTGFLTLAWNDLTKGFGYNALEAGANAEALKNLEEKKKLLEDRIATLTGEQEGENSELDELQQLLDKVNNQTTQLKTGKDLLSEAGYKTAEAIAEEIRKLELLKPLLGDNAGLAFQLEMDIRALTEEMLRAKEGPEELAAKSGELSQQLKETAGEALNVRYELKEYGDIMEPVNEAMEGGIETVRRFNYEMIQLAQGVNDLWREFGNGDIVIGETLGALEDFAAGDYVGAAIHAIKALEEALGTSTTAVADWTKSIRSWITGVIESIEAFSWDEFIDDAVEFFDIFGFKVEVTTESTNRLKDATQNFFDTLASVPDNLTEPVDKLDAGMIDLRGTIESFTEPVDKLDAGLIDLGDTMEGLRDQEEKMYAQRDANRLLLEQLNAEYETTEGAIDGVRAELEELYKTEYKIREIKENIQDVYGVILQLQGDDVNFDVLEQEMIDLGIKAGEFAFEWEAQLGNMFGAYDQFNKDMAEADSVIGTLTDFKVDLDTTEADEAINALIFRWRDYLGTLDPESTAYKNAQESLDALVAKFVAMGGELDEEMAIKFNTALAEGKLDELEAELLGLPTEAEIQLQIRDTLDSLANLMGRLGEILARIYEISGYRMDPIVVEVLFDYKDPKGDQGDIQLSSSSSASPDVYSAPAPDMVTATTTASAPAQSSSPVTVIVKEPSMFTTVDVIDNTIQPRIEKNKNYILNSGGY